MGVWGKLLGAFGGVSGVIYIGKKLYDRYVYDKDGYNGLGRDRDGRDRDGFDVNGLNKEGRDREGFDVFGRDKNGRDRYGFDREGYDINGRDHYGYDKLGYKASGEDRGGKTRDYYRGRITKIEEYLQKAEKEMNDSGQQDFQSALFHIRFGLEIGTLCLIEHKLGNGYESLKLYDRIEKCKESKIIDIDFAEKLHSARLHCNDTSHDNPVEDERTKKEIRQVYFSYKIVEELKSLVKQKSDI